MAYILEHTRLGFCWWDLIALIVLIVVIAAFAWKYCEMKREQRGILAAPVYSVVIID